MDLLNPALAPGWAAEIGATLLLKGTLVLVVAGLLSGGVRRGSAATRYAVWMIALVGLLALPVLPVAFPGVNLAWVTSPLTSFSSGPTVADIGALGPPEASISASSGAGAGIARSLGRWLTSPAHIAGALVVFWLLGVLALLTRLALDWIRISLITVSAARRGVRRDLTRRAVVLARRQGVQRRLRVVLSHEMRVPVTWGLIRPVVLLPSEAEGWTAAHLDAVLLHELAHVRRWDYLTHLLCEVVRALYWPNPLTWVAYRRARMERERACDDAVLRFGTTSTDYARLLLDLAQGLAGRRVVRGVVAMARPSMLHIRINDVLDRGLDRRPAARLSVTAAVVLLVALAGSVGTIRVWASPPRSEADWIATLNHPQPEMRLAAVRMLKELATDPAVEGLTRALSDEDESVRRTSVWALGEVADARVVPALVDVVTGGHGDLHQKRLAATALRSIDARVAELAARGSMLDHGPATRTIRPQVRTPDPAVWKPLVRVLLEDPDPAARSRAAAALVDVGCEAAIPELIHATEDESAQVRIAAARALGAFGTWPAKRALARLLDDPDPAVRAVAETSLECDTATGQGP